MEIEYILIITGLIILVFLAFYAGKALGKRFMFEVMSDVLEKEKKAAIERSRSVLKGQFSEQLSPFEDDFPVKPSEARFLGAPLDFIAFKGLDEKNVEEIVFIEVKSGKAQLNKTERSIRDCVKNKKVRFEEYRLN